MREHQEITQMESARRGLGNIRRKKKEVRKVHAHIGTLFIGTKGDHRFQYISSILLRKKKSAEFEKEALHFGCDSADPPFRAFRTSPDISQNGYMEVG